MKEKSFRLKGLIIGGFIGFLIPWVLLFYSYSTCEGTGCGDYGFALPAIFLMSLFTLFIGALIGYAITSKDILTILFSIAGFILPWIYFTLFAIQRVQLPRLEQKSLTPLFFKILLLSLILLILGVLLGIIISKFKK